jgi:hypothetical protein
MCCFVQIIVLLFYAPNFRFPAMPEAARREAGSYSQR